MRYTIALFGEAEKGQYRTAHVLNDLSQLIDQFGNPPPDSQGIFFAIQALLFQRELIFFRVEEEGFSELDYFSGLKTLETAFPRKIHALCLPGVGSVKILEASSQLCIATKSLLITSQKDWYDYLTCSA